MCLFSLYYYQQEEVEAGVAINQMHQEGVLVQETLAGEVAKMEVNVNITNQKEMVSIDQVPAKTGDIQGIKCQEMVRIMLSQHRILARVPNFESGRYFSSNSQFQ